MSEMDGFSWWKKGNVHIDDIDAENTMKRSDGINNQSIIWENVTSPMSTYVVVVTAICHISVNNTAFFKFVKWSRKLIADT